MLPRRNSKTVIIGGVPIGGGAPIVVQSMTRTDTRDSDATIQQIRELQECGCEIVRVAVPDQEAAESLLQIKKGTDIPIIADIHFDYRLAITALEARVDGLRLNPGNIGDPEHISTVVRAAKERGIPIRIGVNAGSLPKTERQNISTAERMVNAAMEQIHLLESLDFNMIKVSLKAFDISTTIEAYRAIAQLVPYALHLGITEAGLYGPGSIRSALGIGILLYLGIGDTIRVSLTTTDPRQEVAVAFEILKGLRLREKGPTLVSCPTCGRCEVDLVGLARDVSDYLAGVDKIIKVAVMGCVVNGPGEARDADIGIACGRGRGAIFRKGEVVNTVEEHKLLETLIHEIERM
jgi:(E)-4-hydroxy-3-methylbut-2-enyl-diphosphate synthase